MTKSALYNIASKSYQVTHPARAVTLFKYKVSNSLDGKICNLNHVPRALIQEVLTRQCQPPSQISPSPQLPDRYIGRKTDLHGKRRPIGVPAAKSQARPHRTRLRIMEKGGAMLGVTISDLVRDEDLEGGANQFLPRISKHRGDLRIDQRD